MTTKMRTITLTDRPPVTIREDDWPIVASASHKSWDTTYEWQANRTWRGWLKVRQHEDGRALVYGRDDYDTDFRDADGHCYHGGELLAKGADVAAAIRRVAKGLVARGASDAMLQIAHECIGNLPAEAL